MKCAFFVSFADEGADDVICFISRDFEYGNVECLEEAFDVWKGSGYVLRHGITLCLVGRENLVSWSRFLGVEGNTDMSRRLVFYDVQKRIEETEDGGGVAAFAVKDWAADEGKMGAINEGHAIE